MVVGEQITIFDFEPRNTQPVFMIKNRPVLLAEFWCDIKNISIKLKSMVNHRIALCFQDSYQFTTALFACLLVGKTPVLLPNNQPGTLIDFESEYDVILDKDKLNSYVKHAIEQAANQLNFNENQEIILFTSGSTGKAKKIVRTLKQLLCEISVLDKTFLNNAADINIYATVSHQHIYGLIFLILWPLHKNRTINLPILNYPEEIELLKYNPKPVLLVSSPALLKRLCITNSKKNLCPNMTIFSSGGLLEKQYTEITFQIFNLYPYEILGSTETGGIAYRQQQQNNISWSALPLVFLTSDDETKCLKVNSAFFTDDPQQYFLMGDQVKFNPDNTFQLLGRTDRIVKIEEKRISLVDIENQIKKHEFVHDAYALALTSNRQYIALVIELSPQGQQFFMFNKKLILNRKLTQYLVNYFDRILLPKKFRYVTDIPANTQGKRLLSEIKILFEDNENEKS